MDETPPKPKATEEIKAESKAEEAKSASAPAKPQPPPGPQIEYEPFLFYHVMPKPMGKAKLVKPTMAVAKDISINPNPKPQPKPEIKFYQDKRKMKLYGAIFMTVAVFGVLGYLIWHSFFPPKPITIADLEQQALSEQTKNTPTTTPNSTVSIATSPAWQQKYFGNPICSRPQVCGDNADPDNDGLTNLEEFKAGTDPNNSDSDGDGLADGDEVHVFLSDPLQTHSSGNGQYSDADNAKDGYNPINNNKYSSDELQALQKRMQQYQLHEPTLRTIGADALLNIYKFTPQSQSSSTPASQLSTTTPASTATSSTASIDQSPSAKQLRDAQRTTTMQNLGIALIKYKNANKIFPATSDFDTMVADVKPYNLVATDSTDPINQPPYVYGYSAQSSNTDFTLSFFSETQNQLIKLHAADAQKMYADQQASQYDQQRQTDLEAIQSALLLYSNDHVSSSQSYAFPSTLKYKTAIVPKYLSSLPKDPQTGKDYPYQAATDLSDFTLKAVLQSPPTGSTGYMCTRDGCDYY